MRILISGLSMSYLSGQPLFDYELCIELKRQGYEVTMISDWDNKFTGKDGYKLKKNLQKAEVKMLSLNDEIKDEYDLVLASETISQPIVEKIPKTPVINIVNSEYEHETPLKNTEQILKYVCIRYSIKDHLIEKHLIPEDKCVIIYNGVDRTRFKKKQKSDRDFYKIVVPCTLDTMREAFLNKVIDSANEKRKVYIFGMDCGAKLHKNEYVFMEQDKFNIEDDIADADEVAGILLGRVNLEAWSCGVNSSVYDPDTLEFKVYEPPIDFDDKFNIQNTVKKIIGLYIDLDNLTIVIPHYDQIEKLSNLFGDLKSIKHIIISKMGSFAESCNRGFECVKSKYVCFLNDDVRVENVNTFRSMISLCDKDNHIVGCFPDKGCLGFNVKNDLSLEEIKDRNKFITYPSGFCLLMKKETFKKIGGFSEKYKNGCEDIDLYLNAKKKNIRFAISDNTLQHDEASSTGRFDNLEKNIEIFNNKWQGICKI